MKNLSIILGCLSVLCGFVCVFLFIGTVGAYEWDNISSSQFWIQELIACCLSGLTWILYKAGKYFYLYY